MGARAAALVGPVELGDARLNQRLEVVVEQLLDHPQASIPEACGSWAATLAAYRLLENDAVPTEAISAGVGQATVARCPAGDVLLAVQDSSNIDYGKHAATQGLGPLQHANLRGVVLHTTLAVTPAGVPLGLLDQQLWTRDVATMGKTAQRAEIPIEGKESAKWLRSLRRVQQRVDGRCPLVTVADREADVYELFALAAELQSDWVIRACHDRRRVGTGESVAAAVAAAPVLVTQTVEVARQVNHPPRPASVEVRALPVRVSAPRVNGKAAKTQWYRDHPAAPALGPSAIGELSLGVILITEPQPPADVPPVRWLLVTSLPLTTVEEVLTCVQYYRQRWLVERFHYVLKSGCQVERLQLETGQRLSRAVVLYSVVAAWLLLSTYQARITPEAPATTIMDEEAWEVLARVQAPDQPVPTEPPTVREAIRMVARLGGFLGRTGDGDPGVKTIWRGFRRLTELIWAWRIFSQVSSSSPTDINCV